MMAHVGVTSRAERQALPALEWSQGDASAVGTAWWGTVRVDVREGVVVVRASLEPSLRASARWLAGELDVCGFEPDSGRVGLWWAWTRRPPRVAVGVLWVAASREIGQIILHRETWEESQES